jgi:hypothetical protein
MLRRVENVWVEFRYGLGFSTTGRARVHIGNQTVTFGWMKERGSTTNSRWSSRPIRSGWQRSVSGRTGSFKTAFIGRTGPRRR